jgi:hypothetical protein
MSLTISQTAARMFGKGGTRNIGFNGEVGQTI